MDPKELEKVLKKLKADQEKLAKDQQALKEGLEALNAAQNKLAEDKTLLNAEKERLGPLSKIEPAGAEFESKWLKGFTFRSRKAGTPKEKDGIKIKTFVPIERDLKEGDILSWKDKGDHVVLVTADGQKLTVKK